MPDSLLGHCPLCDAALPEDSLLGIRETDSYSVTFAECANCDTLVHPE